jgi:SH3-like domain-containing protein
VIEPPEGARAKIGVNGQWLQIRDADGTQGYVAAWFVAVVSPTAPVPVVDNNTGTVQPPIVKTTAEGLALRSQPVINDNTLIKRLPINSELLVMEPPEQALAKIGVNGQWLQVRDISGTQCYVAAWYVTPATGFSTIGVAPKSTNFSFGLAVDEEPSPVVLRTTVDDLALRSQPQITQATLLKRLRFGSDLLCLDSPQLVKSKISQPGEWLHIQDVEGTQGYVSAVYTIERPELNSGASLAG